MKEKNWHKIFNKKNFSYIDQSNFIKKEKDFLATSYLLTKIVHTELNKKNYKKIINFIYEKLKIKKRSSLLDFGSGNGGLLYYFLKKYNLINNYSFEISAPLLKIQKNFINKTSFFKTHHINLKFLENLKKDLVDNSMSISVFQYFYSTKYCYQVLEFLLRVTKKKILIYDIKNIKTKFNYCEQVRKKQNLTSSEFKKKYNNTPIRFYEKKIFVKVLKKLQNKYDFSFEFHKLPNAAIDHKYGYCLIISKNSSM